MQQKEKMDLSFLRLNKIHKSQNTYHTCNGITNKAGVSVKEPCEALPVGFYATRQITDTVILKGRFDTKYFIDEKTGAWVKAGVK